jgi:hypothetical protein
MVCSVRSVFALSLIAVSAFALAIVPAFGGEPEPVALEIERARAEAEASVVIAKATFARRCSAIECLAAEAKADKLVVEATKSASSCGASVLSPDGRTLTSPDGTVWVRSRNGSFVRSDPGPGCRVSNGQMVCPTSK